MKLALCMGFIWPVKPCSLSFDSFNEAKIMTASRRVIKFTIGKADLSELESIARSRTEPVGRVERAGAAGLPARPIFLCGGASLGHASSEGPTLHRASKGRGCAGGARRACPPGQGADDHRRGQDVGGGVGLPEGEGVGLSA